MAWRLAQLGCGPTLAVRAAHVLRCGMPLRRLALGTLPVLLLACGDDGGGTGGGSSTGGPGTGGGDVVSACAPVTGDGTTHTELTGDETWTAEGSPHIVAADLIVAEGTTLTVAPCSEVRLEPSRRIQVRGTLDATGAADRTILFTATDAAAPWVTLEVTDPGRMTLAHATIENGGAPDATAHAMIDLRGDGTAAAPVLDVDHVTVRGSGSHGISLRGNAGFAPTSTALTVTGSAAAPLRILPRLASNVPDGDLTGNAEDVIAVEAEVGGNVDLEDVTFHDRGVPYRVGGDTLPDLVVGPSPVTLTLEPGVELRFGPAGRLIVDVSGDVGGVLSAVGTADAPIVFTSASATPQPGDWVGIWIEHVDAATRLEHVEIRHAGGPSLANSFHCEPDGTFSDEDALITFWEQPPAGIIADSSLTDSPTRGINLAYTGDPVDLMATNTFENVAGCKISTPRPAEGQCPASSPCP